MRRAVHRGQVPVRFLPDDRDAAGQWVSWRMVAVALSMLLGAFWMTVAMLKFLAPAVKDVLVLAATLEVDPALAQSAYFVLACTELLVGVGIVLPWTRTPALHASFVLAGTLGLAWTLLMPVNAVCGCLGTFTDVSESGRAALIGCPLIASAILSHPRSGAHGRRSTDGGSPNSQSHPDPNPSATTGSQGGSG